MSVQFRRTSIGGAAGSTTGLRPARRPASVGLAVGGHLFAVDPAVRIRLAVAQHGMDGAGLPGRCPGRRAPVAAPALLGFPKARNRQPMAGIAACARSTNAAHGAGRRRGGWRGVFVASRMVEGGPRGASLRACSFGVPGSRGVGKKISAMGCKPVDMPNDLCKLSEMICNFATIFLPALAPSLGAPEGCG